MSKELIRAAVRTLYDHQKLRIQHGNRIAAAFRQKLGLAPSDPETEDEDANKMLNTIRAEYKRITDGVARISQNYKVDSTIITDFGELKMIEAYEQALATEATHEKYIQYVLKSQPIFNDFLLGVRGCGPLMSAVIISEIDIRKCNSISALWKYAGLDVVISEDENGNTLEEGRTITKRHHLVDRIYVNRNGEETKTKGITYNPFLKTKLVGVLGGVFIKLGGEYAEIYKGYKFRLQNHPKHKDKPKLHIHRMAVRYMIKEFLADLWTAWRTMEGLEVRPRYSEEKLGIVHSKAKVA